MSVSATDNSLFPEDSGSGSMSSNLTENYTLTGLRNGDTYNISFIATSQHLPSDAVMLNNSVPLCKYMNTCFL